MAITVTGSIGDQNVLLDNAASEETLKLILAALLKNNGLNIDELKKVFDNVGLDPDTVEEVEENLEETSNALEKFGYLMGQLDVRFDILGRALQQTADYIGTFTNGLGQSSQFFGKLAGEGGVLGFLGQTFKMVAEQGEVLLKNYRELSQVGIGFGGDLTQIRIAAANSYLSLDQFAKIVKENSETFVKMGGTANQGAESFARISNTLMKGNVGDRLRALGFTSEEANSSLAKFIGIMGGVSATEARDTEKLSKLSGEYMTELDTLARVTGKSRQQIEEQTKKAALQAAVEQKMQSMTLDQRKQAEAALKIAAASGIDGAVEAVQAQLAGLPPMSEEAQKFAAMAPEAYSSLMKTTDKAMSGTLKDFNGAAKDFALASGQSARNLGDVGSALTFMDGATGKVATGLIKFDNMFRGSPEEVEKRFNEALKEQSEAEKSMAMQMANVEKDFQRFGQALISAFMPVLQIGVTLLNMFSSLVGGAATVITSLGDFGKIVALIGTVVLVGFKYQMIRATKEIGESLTRSLVNKIFGGRGGEDEDSRRRGGRGPSGGRGGGGKFGGTTTDMTKTGKDLGGFANALGPGIKGVLTGLAKGLAAFADPKVLQGALYLGIAIVGISAAISASAWMIGQTLPTLAKGLKSFDEINGANLLLVGAGIVAIGAGLFALAGGQAAKGAVDFFEGLGTLFGGKTTIDKLREFASIGEPMKVAGEGLSKFVAELVKLSTINVSGISAISDSLKNMAGVLAVISLHDLGARFNKNFFDAIFGAESGLVGQLTKISVLGPGMSESANALKDFTASLNEMAAIDVEKIEKIANSVSNLKRTSIIDTTVDFVAGLFKSPNEEKDNKGAKVGADGEIKSTTGEITPINNDSMIKILQRIEENTAKTITAVNKINNNALA